MAWILIFHALSRLYTAGVINFFVLPMFPHVNLGEVHVEDSFLGFVHVCVLLSYCLIIQHAVFKSLGSQCSDPHNVSIFS